MCKLCTQLSHLVHFINPFAGEEVQAVQVLGIARDFETACRLLDGDDRFEDDALTFLNPLAHGVKVGREVHGCREDTFVVLTFRLTVKLLPPFAHIVQLRMVVDEDFNLLAILCIQGIAHCCIHSRRVLHEGHVRGSQLLHRGSSLHQFFDVITGSGDGKQTHRSQYGEASAYVVGDDE